MALFSNPHLTTRPKKDWSYSSTLPPGLHGLLWGKFYFNCKILLLIKLYYFQGFLSYSLQWHSSYWGRDLNTLSYLFVRAHVCRSPCASLFIEYVRSYPLHLPAHSFFPLCRNCRGAFLLFSVMYSKYMWPFMVHYIHAKLFSRSSHTSVFLTYLRIYTAVSSAFVVVPLGGYKCDKIHSFNLICFGVMPGVEVRKMERTLKALRD